MIPIKPPTLEEFNASCRPDEIVRAPNVILMAPARWNKLSSEEKSWIRGILGDK